MNKIKIFLIIILLGLLPLLSFAQVDFDVETFIKDIDLAKPGIIINSVNLIWSTNTYTPHEYQGRTLPSRGSEVKIEAIVNISGDNANNLRYSWFLENIFQRSKSGYGRNSFSFSVGQMAGKNQTVKLQIFNENRSVFKEKTLKIPIVAPELIVYPLNGNSNFSDQTSKISTIIAGKEFSFIAKPYFFNIKKLTDLEFEWRLAGQEPIISSDYDANVLDLTITGKESEEILENDLLISVKNKVDTKQKAIQTIKLQIY